MKQIRKILTILLILSVICVYSSVIVMAEEETWPVYNATWDIYYSTLEDALAEADSNDIIYLEADYTMTQSAYVDSNVTLIITSNASRNDTTTGNNHSGSVTAGSAFATLTIPNNVSLIVDGTLLVAGNQQSTQPKSGYLTGDYGAIELSGDIVVNGKLYARGMIDGTGTVTASEGSEVYQLMQIADWRGGTASSAAYALGLFPFNLYEVSNIRSNATYQVGSSLKGQVYIYMNSTGYNPVVDIIDSDGLLYLSDGEISTSYSSGVLTATINGSVQTGDISLSVGSLFNSYGRVLPFGYKMDVVIESTGELEIANYIKLLPGCNITNTGTLKILSGGALYVYNAAQYSTSYNFAHWTSSADATITSPSTVVRVGSGFLAQSATSGTKTVYEYTQGSWPFIEGVRFAVVS